MSFRIFLIRVCSVLGVYRAHPLFFPLVLVLAGVMLIIKCLQVLGMWLLIEDAMTLWLMAWMIQGFLFGILVKRQLVFALARTLPGYRVAVIGAFVLIFALVSGGTVFWMACLPEMTPSLRELMPLTMLCALTYLITVFVAYVSVRWLVMGSYVVLLFIVTRVLDIVRFVTDTPHVFAGLCALVFALTALLITRMALLREGAWEFPYLLSWPLYRSFGEDNCGAREGCQITIAPYMSLKGTWARARHWDFLEGVHLWGAFIVLVAGVGIFAAHVLAQGVSSAFYNRPFSNFLVFVVTPIFIAQCFNYRIIAFGQTAVLWPVRREELIRRWGQRVAGYLGAAWLLTVIFFAVMPALLLDQPIILSARFWVYLVLTGVFGYFVMAWLVLLSAMGANWRVALYMVLLCVIVQLEFLVMPKAGVGGLLLNIACALGASAWLTREAYRKWMEVEF